MLAIWLCILSKRLPSRGNPRLSLAFFACFFAVATITRGATFANSPLPTTPSENEITFTGGEGFSLHGTLSLPARAQTTDRVAAVLLLPGSGPTDRDGNQPPQFKTDLLKQIAQALSKQGVATFRFDKRAAHVYSSDWPKDSKALPAFFSWQNHLRDVAAAFEKMCASPTVDSARCSILGHSEGGLLALSSSSVLKPASLVLIGTAGRPLRVVVQEQVAALLKKQGASESVAKTFLAENEKIQKQIISDGTLPNDVPPGLRALYPPSTISYLHEVLAIDPTAFARSYSGPVLVMNGEKDVQVSPSQDADALMAALRKRPEGMQEVFIVPGASHNLKKISSDADLGMSGMIAADASAKIGKWFAAGSYDNR